MKKLMVVAALLVFMAGTAYAAAEWEFYGSARVSTFYTQWDMNMFDSAAGRGTIVGSDLGAALLSPDTDKYEQDINGNARIGANIKVSDEVTARFEYGAKDGSPNLRLLWGEWNFGAGSLGVGQHYTPLLFPYSNQVYNIYPMKDGDTNMSTFGMLYGKRKPMVRLKFGNFQIAAVQPNTSVNYEYISAASSPATAISGTYAIPTAQPTTKVQIPCIQAKYRYDFDWGHLNFAGGYQTFDVVDTAANKEFEVRSYVLGVGGRVNMGKAYFKANAWGGENVGNMADILVGPKLFSTVADASASNRSGSDVGFALYNNGSVAGETQQVVDNEAFAALLVLGYEIRRGLYVEGGYGYTSTELKKETTQTTAFSRTGTRDMNTWYLQSTIFLAENVFLTPEVGGLDGESDNQLDVFYAGIKWQINF